MHNVSYSAHLVQNFILILWQSGHRFITNYYYLIFYRLSRRSAIRAVQFLKQGRALDVVVQVQDIVQCAEARAQRTGHCKAPVDMV